jgi:hypothetical protein
MASLDSKSEKEQHHDSTNHGALEHSAAQDSEQQSNITNGFERETGFEKETEAVKSPETPAGDFPHGLRLISILTGIILAFFLVALDSVGH